MKLSKQLFLWFSLLLVTAIVLTLLLANKYINEAKVISRNKELITDLKLSYLSSNVLVSNFLSIESVNPQFFKTGTSSFIDQKFKKDSLIYSHFNLLKLQHVDEETRLKAIKTLEVNMNQQELLFTKMVHKVWERGYKDYGLVGRMRSHAHHLESVHQFDKELLLSLRRREKDFIIRHETQYIQNFDSIVAQIRHYVAKEKINADIKNNYLESLLQYAHCFHTLVDLDIELGVYNNSGLKASLDRFQFEAQNALNLLQEQFNRDAEKALTQLKLFYILGAIALFVFCLTLSALLSKKITNPLVIFTQHLNSMSRLCFAQLPELELRRFSKEVKVLYQTFNRLISQLSVHETERNMLINKLVSSEEKYRNMADRLPQSVFETNVKGEFKYTNSHWQKSFGYKEAELGSQITLDKLIIKKKHSKEQARLNEVVAKRKDGSWFPALLYTDEIINEGQVKGVRGVVIDISDRYRYLKMLKAERRKAMAADKLKSAFIANVSHEVRTPLNAVLGYSHLLNDRLPKHVDDEGFIKQIIANGHQLLHLFDDIMDFSLIKTDLFQVKKSELDVNDLLIKLEESVLTTRSTFNKPHLDVNITLLPNKTDINSDKRHINTIFRHLIQNAFKFTDKGQIDIGAYESEHQLIFFVKDTGKGISNEEQKLIFEPFRQIEEGLARSYQGTGIGLALCKGLITNLDGHIWLVSEPNEGTTFYFSLPLNNVVKKQFQKCDEPNMIISG